MPGVDRFTFNGLKGSDLIVFNLLSARNDLSLSTYDIARLTCYNPETIRRSLKRLRLLGIIESKRAKLGQKYKHIIKR